VWIKASDVGDSHLRGKLLEFNCEWLVPHRLEMEVLKSLFRNMRCQFQDFWDWLDCTIPMILCAGMHSMQSQHNEFPSGIGAPPAFLICRINRVLYVGF